MRISSQAEQQSTDQFLLRLGVAIDEARHARSIINSSDRSANPRPHEPVSHKLLLVDREIELLEEKMKKVRCQE